MRRERGNDAVIRRASAARHRRISAISASTAPQKRTGFVDEAAVADLL